MAPYSIKQRNFICLVSGIETFIRQICANAGRIDIGRRFQEESNMATQADWCFCHKCNSMFFNGFPQKGRCAAGGAHEPQGFNFTLPHDIPGALEFNFAPIVFGGTPVGGNAHVTLRQDGSFVFSRHFRDSGAPDFNDAIVAAIKDSQNIGYTFQHTGHMSGTFSSGSRDDDWRVDSRDDRLINNWAYIAAGSRGHARSTTSADITNIVRTLLMD